MGASKLAVVDSQEKDHKVSQDGRIDCMLIYRAYWVLCDRDYFRNYIATRWKGCLAYGRWTWGKVFLACWYYSHSGKWHRPTSDAAYDSARNSNAKDCKR